MSVAPGRALAFRPSGIVNLWDDTLAPSNPPNDWTWNGSYWRLKLAAGTRDVFYSHAGLTNSASVRVTGTATGLAASSSTLSFILGQTAAQGSITTDGPFSVDIAVGLTNDNIGMRCLPGGAGDKDVSGLQFVYI